MKFTFASFVFVILLRPGVDAQPTPDRRSDVTNKALITKATPSVSPSTITNKSAGTQAAELHKLAQAFYAWRNENAPVASSDQGLHTWDDRLTDFSPAKVSERAEHVHA